MTIAHDQTYAVGYRCMLRRYAGSAGVWREGVRRQRGSLARMPNFNRFWSTSPHAFLHTSGRDVGLPDGQMGNSEVGHINMGAGRVVMQDLPRIDEAVADGSLAEARRSPAWSPAQEKRRRRASDGTGVAGRRAFASGPRRGAGQDFLPTAGVRCVSMRFTDGRDTPPQSAAEDSSARAALPRAVPIATVSGRYFAMDRDKRWDRVDLAYGAMVDAEGPRFADAPAAVADAYANKQFDEFVLPAVIGDYHGMNDGDGVLCFNFRADRVREILAALLDPAFLRLSRASASSASPPPSA